ncbi:MAG TPA: acylphosphatase [Aridibacter sp.]|nr:acylphosphatase [Aridibacter sp.]
MKIARKFYVSGIVQGVGFRFFVQRSAAKHQVVGYVRNLADGRVEAYAEGSERALKDFYEDLLTGPKFSEVNEVEEIVADAAGEYSSFLIER